MDIPLHRGDHDGAPVHLLLVARGHVLADDVKSGLSGSGRLDELGQKHPVLFEVGPYLVQSGNEHLIDNVHGLPLLQQTVGGSGGFCF